MFWPLHFAWKYFLINSKWVVIKKWRIPEKEEKTASCVLENFCEIFVSSTEFCHCNDSHQLILTWFCMTCCSDKVLLQRQFFEKMCNSPVHTKQFVAAMSPWDVATTCHLVCSNILQDIGIRSYWQQEFDLLITAWAFSLWQCWYESFAVPFVNNLDSFSDTCNSISWSL